MRAVIEAVVLRRIWWASVFRILRGFCVENSDRLFCEMGSEEGPLC